MCLGVRACAPSFKSLGFVFGFVFGFFFKGADPSVWHQAGHFRSEGAGSLHTCEPRCSPETQFSVVCFFLELIDQKNEKDGGQNSPVEDALDILLSLFFLISLQKQWVSRFGRIGCSSPGVCCDGAESGVVQPRSAARAPVWITCWLQPGARSQVTGWNQRDFPWMNIL